MGSAPRRGLYALWGEGAAAALLMGFVLGLSGLAVWIPTMIVLELLEIRDGRAGIFAVLAIAVFSPYFVGKALPTLKKHFRDEEPPAP